MTGDSKKARGKRQEFILTNYQSPIPSHQSPIPNHQSPITKIPCYKVQFSNN
ncbi:hypothetical protein [Sphaerospermopsis aphanizomenoides]|uniref:hypothetical protein n=1 Tax=Sphaerospermopsis aphanizomenoides TaxID=459663 RepID=UPI00187F5F9F|nr:hypothetical protein [Sphaerospermopsis aphanizomenoides]